VKYQNCKLSTTGEEDKEIFIKNFLPFWHISGATTLQCMVESSVQKTETKSYRYKHVLFKFD
jgi:hypothetical protein